MYFTYLTNERQRTGNDTTKSMPKCSMKTCIAFREFFDIYHIKAARTDSLNHS